MRIKTGVKLIMDQLRNRQAEGNQETTTPAPPPNEAGAEDIDVIVDGIRKEMMVRLLVSSPISPVPTSLTQMTRTDAA